MSWRNLNEILTEQFTQDELGEVLGASSNTSSISQGWENPIPLDEKKIPTFPVNIFPNWLRQYVNAVAEETQTPKDAAAMAAISILSTILGGKYVVKPNGTSWTETLSIYSVIALDPANRKSAVFSLFQRPISEFEKEERERLAPIILEEQAERKAVRKRIDELNRQYSKTEDKEEGQAILKEIQELEKEVDEGLNPSTRYPRFFTSDVTPEKLAELMYLNDGKFSVLSSEGAEVFDMVAGRYSDKFNLDLYLKAYSGDNVTIDRKSSPSILLENPTLTIGLFVQPSVIQELPVKFSNRGLTQRFLFFLPRSFVCNRKINPEPISISTKRNFQSNIRKLLEMDDHKQNDVEFQLHLDEQNILTFDNEAQEHLMKIQTKVEIMLGNQDLNIGLKGWLGKLVGQIIRIAGLLHIAEHITNGRIPNEINKNTLMIADSLRDYFIQHAEAAFGIIGENENIDDVKYVSGKITSKKFEKRTEIDYQEIWQMVKKRFKKSEKLKEILITLEEMNYIKNSIDGRKQVILVNPYLQKNYPNYPNSIEMQSHQEFEAGESDSLKVPYYPSEIPSQNQIGEYEGESVPFRGKGNPSETSWESKGEWLLGVLGEESTENENKTPIQVDEVSEDGSGLI